MTSDNWSDDVPDTEDILRLIAVTETVSSIFVSEKMRDGTDEVEEVLVTARFLDGSVVTVNTMAVWYALSWILTIAEMLSSNGRLSNVPSNIDLN